MTEPPRDRTPLSPIAPRALIEHATRVMAQPAPDHVDCRRATSAAYYALFHALTVEAAATLVPGGDPARRYRDARRFEHRALRAGALWTVGAGTAPERLIPLAAVAQGDREAQAVAQTLLALALKRRNADYNHFAEFGPDVAKDAILSAAVAVDAVESSSFAGGEGGRAFLELLASQAGDLPPDG